MTSSKVAVDLERARAGQFVLTGSQKFTLMQEIADSLAGRAAILELESLSWAEISKAQPEWTVEERLLRGGSPSFTETQNWRGITSIVPIWPPISSGMCGPYCR